MNKRGRGWALVLVNVIINCYINKRVEHFTRENALTLSRIKYNVMLGFVLAIILFKVLTQEKKMLIKVP